MDVHGVLTDYNVRPPYEVDQFASAEYLGWFPHEDAENCEGFGGELHLSSGNCHLVSISVQFDRAHMIDSSPRALASRPPEIGTDFGDQKAMSILQIVDAVHPSLQIRYKVALGIKAVGRNYCHQENMVQ
jgi:hypothetical protein